MNKIIITILVVIITYQTWVIGHMKKLENDRLTKQIELVQKQNDQNMGAIENAYEEKNKYDLFVTNRKEQADRFYTNIGEQDILWINAIVPDRIVTSLCQFPGSCTVPETGNTPEGLNDRRTGTATKETYSLTNGSLKDGIEDLRYSLGKCNNKIKAIQKWSIKIRDTP